MIKIGLTGGIGTGKTTVAKEFEAMGVPVYYADDRAKELMQKDPKIILFLQEFLFSIITSIIAWLIIDYTLKPKLEPILKNDKILIEKNLKKRLKTYIKSPKERTQYRIVNVDRLNIREGQSRKTEIISHLAFADVVQIIKKKKNWTLIKKYNEEQETVIQGWVFTRYLTPIK